MNVMALAMTAGICTSIILETIILSRTQPLKTAFRIAVGMSLISMIGMETAMNAMDWALTGGARLTWWVLPPMWLAGFLTLGLTTTGDSPSTVNPAAAARNLRLLDRQPEPFPATFGREYIRFRTQRRRSV